MGDVAGSQFHGGGGGATSFIVCYAPTMITTSGVWQGDNPLDYSLPLFIVQVLLVVSVTRTVAFLLKPLRQPRFVADVIGGLIMGPTVLGKIPNYLDVLFPTRSVAVIETMANLGLVYFMFLVGLEVDLAVVKRTGRKAMTISLAGTLVPFATALITFVLLRPELAKSSQPAAFLLFVGVSISATAFSVLSRILAELKLLTSEPGRLAMSSAIIHDCFAWILLALAIAIASNRGSMLAPMGVIFSGITFLVVGHLTVKPAVMWIMRRTPEGENVDDLYVCIIMTAVMVCGLAADALGMHAIFGAFALGLMIPNGPVGVALIEKLEDYVTGFMMPLFFAINGIRVDIDAVVDSGTAWLLVVALCVAAAAKVGTTVLVSMFYGMPAREGLSLGILLNTKGLIEMIVLHIGLDKKVLDRQSFTVMVLMSLALTAVVTPLVTVVYRPARRFVSYKRRTIQRSKPDAELRMLACVHATRNVPSIISLLEISHPSKRSPIFVYALHLVELTGRESAMLIVHETHRRSDNGRGSSDMHGVDHHHGGNRNLNRMQAQSHQIVHAFESYEQHAGGVSVQPLTAVSAYSTMHEDICNIAEDKRVALVILPFHKQQTVDGGMEVTNPGIRVVNQSVLEKAPCSVGILVDRGLGGTARIAAGHHAAHHIALLFFGGPDDREALAYAGRMAEHPGISLSVLRFVHGSDAAAVPSGNGAAPRQPQTDHARVLTVITTTTERERELQLDDEYIKDFRLKNVSNESVAYSEKVVDNGEETVTAIRAMDGLHDLYIVGRGHGRNSPLTSGLTDWSECPELGVIGDLLASSDFGATVSVLVVQQYTGGVPAGEGPGTPAVDSPSNQNPVQQFFSRAANKGRATSSWAVP